MTDEDYKRQQTSLIDSLLETNKNLREEAWDHLGHISSEYYDFDRSM
jgi:secreted Zn-dependent insulinase-like peptidase